MISLATILALALPAASAPVITPTLAYNLRVDDYSDALAEVNAALAAALDTYAKWCQKSQAYRERDLAYGRILQHSPDHKLARRTLGYSFDRKADGWKRKRKYRQPKASKPDLARQARERLNSVDSAHLAQLAGFLDGERGGSSRQRSELLQRLLLVNPDNADLRKRSGQVRAERQGEVVWVLRESALALTKRGQLRKLRKDLKANWPKPQRNQGPRTGEWGLSWPFAGATDRVRIYGNSSESEAMRTLEACHNIWDYTAGILDHQMTPSLSIYMVKGDSQREALVKLVAEGDEPFLALLQQVSCFRNGKQIYSYSPYSPNRIDGACRQTLDALLAGRFGIAPRQGWATEGFGMYLTERMLGTRQTYFIRQTKYVDQSDRIQAREMRELDADWLVLARRALGGKRRPNIAIALGRDVNDLSSKDLLLSFALAAFLMEGHPAKVTVKILERVGKGENSILVLEQELGYDIRTLGKRLHQWLTEIL